MTNKDVALRRVYAQIPRLDCKGLCQESCGPIACSREERRRIVRYAGTAPKPRADLTCALLLAGKCRAYTVRPMLCRLWGVVETMPCPHGCVPERWLSHEEGQKLLGASLEIGGTDRHMEREVAATIRRFVEGVSA